MILFDGTHLTSNRSLNDLLKFGRKVGLKAKWLQRSNRGLLHFDITTEGMTRRVEQAGVKKVRPREILTGGIRGDLPVVQAPVRKQWPIQLKRSNGLKRGSAGKGRGEIVQPGGSGEVKKWWKGLRRRKTGELEFFVRIWRETPISERVSFLDGTPILYFDIRCFMHVLPKKLYPKFRLERINIVFGTPDQHRAYDQGTELESKGRYEALGEDWPKLYLLREELRVQYRNLESPILRNSLASSVDH